MVVSPEVRFSLVEAHMILVLCFTDHRGDAMVLP